MRSVLILAAVSGLLFFANLGGPHLWDEDEAIFAQTAREMHQSGELIVPTFNGELFAHKPPLMYWFMASAYDALGTTELAARFWSAVFGIGSVLLTYRLGRLIFSPTAAFWSALALASNVNFNVIARAATPDSLLVFFSTLAVVIFVSGTAKARPVAAEPNERNAPWIGQTAFEPPWATYALAYAAMGLAVLTKGPIGVVLPTAAIGLFLLVMRAPSGTVTVAAGWAGRLRSISGWLARVFAPRHVARTIWSMRPLTALATVLAVAGPWYVLVGVRTDGAFLSGFFGTHNFGRFLTPMENHRGPFFYYFIAMAAGFFPWSVFFGPGLVDMTRQLRTRSPWRAGYVLVCAWITVWVGFFSLAGTKLPSYIVPAYPALALFTGALVDRWLREPAAVSRWWARAVWGTVALAGVGMLIALPIVAHVFLSDDDWSLGAVGLIPLAGAAVGWVCSERLRTRAAVATLGVVSVALALALFAVSADRVDDYRDTPRFARVIADAPAADEPAAVASYHYFRPSFVFYTGSEVEQFQSGEDVRRFFAQHPRNAFLLTTRERYDEIASQLPADVTVVDTARRFLRPGQAVLLGRPSQSPATAARETGDKAN